MMNNKQKILLCGDVEGRFNALFSRVETINNKSGPFDLLLCVGNFFGVNNVEFNEYISGSKKVAVPTYILGPNSEGHGIFYLESNPELCHNVTYLGKRGIFNTSAGLKIAYLSGLSNLDTKIKSKPYEFDKEDAISLRDTCVRGHINYRGIDILLTSQWPKGITNFDKQNIPESTNGSELVSWLAVELKPRYHVAGLEGVYYERSPYRNLDPQGEATGGLATRFIGMARVGNPKKDKWIYALSLMPLDSMRNTEIFQRTTDETVCPYDGETLMKAGKLSDNIQYFYDMDCADDKRKRDEKDGPRKRPRPAFDQGKCWFCLGSPEVEKHLVVSVGNATYLALAKGGLINEHLLILPIEHHQCLIGIPDAVNDEISMFKEALKKYFHEQEKVPVFFERNYKTSHLQIQVVPVPVGALREMVDIFKDEAEANGIKLEELPSHNRLDQVIPEKAPYFYVELPNVRLYTRCRSGFPLQFGREVLASGPILNMPDRADWKECSLPRAEEDLVVQRIRKDFERFDFTL